LLWNKALSLKGDLVSGNYRSALQGAVDLGLVLSRSPKAAEVTAEVEEMNSESLPPANLAPTATAALVPIADQLLQAIDAGEARGVNEQISSLIQGIADVYKAEVRHGLSNSAFDSDAAEARYTALHVSLAASLARNSVGQSVALATELQVLLAVRRLVPPAYRIFFYGSGLYEVNDAFGRAAFFRGDYKAASEYLLQQTEIPPEGVVGMCRSGPNLWLAQSLLRAGYRDEVLTFLQGVGKYWTKDSEGKLDVWTADLKKGIMPDMRLNNRADFGYRY
jgi:hypothetical protein